MKNDGGPYIIRTESDGWRFELPFDLIGDEELEEDSLGFGELLDMSFVVSATLPGNPVEHNADRVTSECDSSTFYWDVDIFNPPEWLSAQTDGLGDCDEGWGTGPTVAVVLLGVLVVLVGAAALVRRRRSVPSSEPSDLE